MAYYRAKRLPGGAYQVTGAYAPRGAEPVVFSYTAKGLAQVPELVGECARDVKAVRPPTAAERKRIAAEAKAYRNKWQEV